MTAHTTPPTDDEIIEHARTAGLVEPEKAPAFVAAFQAEQERRTQMSALGITSEEAAANVTANMPVLATAGLPAETSETTHQGPDPFYGGLSTHVGTREKCTAPDCGPLDPEDELRDAVLDLEALSEAAHGDTWRIAREQETHPKGDGSFHVIGIEPVDGDADIVVFQDTDISEEDAAYIAAMGPNVGHLLANLLHEIAEDSGPELDNRQAIHQAAHKLATTINNRPQ
ncbi:hypothetical protein ABMX48_31565 [Streptomyces cavourensis]